MYYMHKLISLEIGATGGSPSPQREDFLWARRLLLPLECRSLARSRIRTPVLPGSRSKDLCFSDAAISFPRKIENRGQCLEEGSIDFS
jgi:hypothetical protein